MTVFFTSDTHFSHANIIEYCDRPFKDVPHMDAELVRRWNSVVTSYDEVYHLGDFGFRSDPGTHLNQLKGKIHLIHGNHDSKRIQNLTRWAS